MNPHTTSCSEPVRLHIVVRGAVQGVGFRPFVYRLATELALGGWVVNSPIGVLIEAEGTASSLREFLVRLQSERPPLSRIQSLEPCWLDPVGYSQFEIRPSVNAEAAATQILPDIATCADCLREIFDPNNRRYFHPFANCTHCGPRFSIIQALPYDRANTTMRGFAMCPKCRREYEDPADRRFHAQPNACPDCGPTLALWNPGGSVLSDPDPLRSAAAALQSGGIVAAKGLGGFHLLCMASNQDAVQRLRQRKHREEKPLAVMFASMAQVEAACHLSDLEARALQSPEAPIVLLRRRLEATLAPGVAPGNPFVGALLPYTPLYHLLLALVGQPVVATSGNLSDEPICTDELDAIGRLSGIADLFLVHNRPIVRHVDDSLIRIVAGREMVLRRARGFAPLPVYVRRNADAPVVLAVGAHLKNTVALAKGSDVFMSQHIGDLETEPAFSAFTRVAEDLQGLLQASPSIVAHDDHPDYLSTRHALELARMKPALTTVSVQHHLAHALACMGENQVTPPCLGVAWDGTGYGLDGTIWGGEFFELTGDAWQRAAHLKGWSLPGGDQSVREPRRTALGLLYELFKEDAFGLDQLPTIRSFTPSDLDSLRVILSRGFNSPRTTSIGRLFDAVSSLAGLRQRVKFEGQAAMDLEFVTDTASFTDAYPFAYRSGNPGQLDWEPLLRGILSDIEAQAPAAQIGARFHRALAQAIVTVAKTIGHERVLLSGGCFQNRVLTELAVAELHSAGFRPYWHQRVPPNDGGIALGQVVAVGTTHPLRK